MHALSILALQLKVWTLEQGHGLTSQFLRQMPLAMGIV